MKEIQKQGNVVTLNEDYSFSSHTPPLPQLAAGEILAKIDSCTLCKSDIHTARGKRKEALPSVLGHEAVGTVIGIGEMPPRDVFGEEISVGDRILWAVYTAPNAGSADWLDREQKSPGIQKYGHLAYTPERPFTGGLASHIRLFPHTPVAKIPAHIPVEILAPVNCSLATMVGAFRLAGDIKGKRVAIIGSGMLGLQGAAYARAQGCAELLLIDVLPERASWVKAFGADEFLLPEDLEKWDSFDVIIETSGSVSGMENSLKLAALGASIVWVGAVFPQKTIPINPERLIRKLHSLKGLHNYSIGDFKGAVQHMIQHHSDFPYHDLVQATFSLEQVPEAFEAAEKPGIFRVEVRP